MKNTFATFLILKNTYDLMQIAKLNPPDGKITFCQFALQS